MNTENSGILEKKRIMEKIKKVKWFHSIPLGPIVTSGIEPLEFEKWIAQAIPTDLTSKSVLDIGAWDGYYSFLCESRGARAIAIDLLPQRKRGQSIRGFLTAKKVLNSNVEYILMDLYDIDSLDAAFDIVLFLGVYYHLKHPLYALEKIYNKTRELLVLEGEVLNGGFLERLLWRLKREIGGRINSDLKSFGRILNTLSCHMNSIMKIYHEGEFRPPFSTTYCVASVSCIIKMLTIVGFREATLIDRRGSRALFIARK